MPIITRRELLKGMAAAGAFSAFPFGLTNMVFAAEPGAPVLVVVHLRGGCDGLNFVSPATDADFIAARSSDLRVQPDGPDAGYALDNGPDPKIDFRLNHAAGGLAELYKQGDLAFIHACGLTDSTRSHFVATDMIEHGVGTEKDLSRIDTGWLARAFTAKTAPASSLQAVSINGAVTGDLDGMGDALAVPNLNNGMPYVGGAQVSSAIWSMYANINGPIGEAGRNALLLPAIVDRNIPRDMQGHAQPYQPAIGADYNSSGGLAGPLKTVAQLIKMDIGLRAITVDYGGWDTHEYQAGRFHGLIEPLSNGLAAFWNDVQAFRNRVVVVTVTEFGRRLRSNKSGGTDHGRASLMAVIAGGANGGKFYGKWPGLSSGQLDEGVDLVVTTDYRQVLTEVLNHVQGRTENTWFPGYTSPGDLGIF